MPHGSTCSCLCQLHLLCVTNLKTEKGYGGHFCFIGTGPNFKAAGINLNLMIVVYILSTSLPRSQLWWQVP